MHASDYLRMKLQSDRHLAMSVQNGFRGVIQTAKGVASDIYAGIERASWYTSCLIPQYHEVCHELAREETRMLYSIASVFQHRDVLQHMLYLYFKTVLADIDNGNPDGQVRNLTKGVTHFAANLAVAKETRLAIAETISLLLAHSEFLSGAVVKKIAGITPVFTAALQLFGLEQKAAMAARRLKALDPRYYWILYNAKLEMLYYFVEPVLNEIIIKTNAGFFTDTNALIDEITRMFHV